MTFFTTHNRDFSGEKRGSFSQPTTHVIDGLFCFSVCVCVCEQSFSLCVCVCVRAYVEIMEFIGATLEDGLPVFIRRKLPLRRRVEIRADLRNGRPWSNSVRMDVDPGESATVVCARCIADRTTAL